ncbi:hypothetical protein [Paractinoplanes maris]|uniref:hypothetical protein n=1 Tax=Paractinoplanes maris TaxID=1734446 RepID=UPI0020215B67|nr:hypothetical protein [Actinoplanes maris]
MAVAAAAIGAGLAFAATPANAATTADVLPMPWQLSWGGAKASGTFSTTQAPLGLGRTYTLKGVVRTVTEQCHFVRATDTLTGKIYNSPASCGSAAATFTTTATQSRAAAITVKLCRGNVTATACSPAITLN